jgi:RimJ/RimL family protein N-acetyltransferase
MSEQPRFVPLVDPRPDARAWPSAIWPPSDDVALSNEFIELRPSRVEDAAELFAALDHDAVWAHVAGRPADVDAMVRLIDWKRAEPTWFPWTVRLVAPLAGLAAGTVVGTSSYLETSPNDARTEIGSTTYSPSVWASAVNPSAKLLLLEFAFESLNMSRVQLKTDVRNARSQQAIARLGATCEGLIHQYQRRADGSIRDTVLFSIVDTQWPSVRDGLTSRLRG